MKKYFTIIFFILCIALSLSFFFFKNQKPNVVFISLDTLRMDAVGLYNDKITSHTPDIDRLGNDSVVYRQAYAPIPFTLSSHMSMMTGVYPDVHLVTGESKIPGADGEKILSSKIATLAEILKGEQYNTGGLYSSAWLKDGFGFGRGFDSYSRVTQTPDLATVITDKALGLIEKFRGAKQPFFLFLHYYDPHSDFWSERPPYSAPKEYQLLENDTLAKHFCTSSGKCATEFLLESNINKTILPTEDIRDLRRLYHAGVRFVDSEIGRLIDGLKISNCYDDTIIVITSDHGEEFQEHGKLLHEQTYEETARVPLIIKYPKNKYSGLIVDKVCELIDIFPTVLEYLHVSISGQVQGESLIPAPGNSDEPERAALMQDKVDRNVYALRVGDFKLRINSLTGGANLFDLKNDPEEVADISSGNPTVLTGLLRKFEEKRLVNERMAKLYQEIGAKSGKAILDKSERDRLKSLGYIQ